MMVNEIDKQTYLLFNRTYGDDTSQEYDLLLDKVEQQITEFGWDKTFESWKNYLFTECKTPESAINFANLFSFLLNVKPLNQLSILQICSGVMEVRTILSLNRINS